jgi:hypothetical protein
MKRSALSWITQNRKTIVHFGTESGTQGHLQGEAHMFWDDVHMHVMPVRGLKGKRAVVRLREHDPAWNEFVLDALDDFDRHDNRDLTESVEHFVEHAASLLIYDGRAAFEVVWGPTHPQLSGQRQFAFVYFPLDRVYRRRGKYVQEGVVRTWNKTERFHKALLDKKDVLEVRLPSWLGGAAAQRQFLQTLSELTPLSVRWPYEQMAEAGMTAPFDFNRFKFNTYVRLARATRLWDWNARELWREETLEYYQVHRLLQFHGVLARLRDYILEALNDKLMSLGCTSRLICEGLPSSHEIHDLQERLRRGESDFDAVIKTVYGS